MRGCVREIRSAVAYPTRLRGRHASHQCVSGYVARNHGPGRHETIFAEGYSANDSCVRTDRGASFDQGAAVFIFAIDVAAWIYNVGEDHGRPTENVVLQLDPGVDGNIVLDLDIIPDLYGRADYHVLSQVAEPYQFLLLA